MKVLKFLFAAIFYISSLQVDSQIVLSCDCEDDPEYIQNCLQNNRKFVKEHQIKSIIHYTSNRKIEKYDSVNHIVINFNEFSCLDNYKTIVNGNESIIFDFNYDDENNLISIIKKSTDTSCFKVYENEKIEYKYENKRIVERIKTSNGQLVNSFNYIFNDSLRKNKVVKNENGRSNLIKEIFYNSNNLIDSVFYYSFSGNNLIRELYKYDLNNNEIEKVVLNSELKTTKISQTAYKYDLNSRILEKRITNNDYPKFIFLATFEYNLNGKNEQITQYEKDLIISIKECHYDTANNLISSKILFGYGKGKYENNIYDLSLGLRIYRERNNNLNDYWIYELRK